MYVCMYVRYVRIHYCLQFTFICKSVYKYARACVRACVCMYVYLCLCDCMSICVRVTASVYVGMYVCANVCMYACMSRMYVVHACMYHLCFDIAVSHYLSLSFFLHLSPSSSLYLVICSSSFTSQPFSSPTSPSRTHTHMRAHSTHTNSLYVTVSLLPHLLSFAPPPPLFLSTSILTLIDYDIAIRHIDSLCK